MRGHVGFSTLGEALQCSSRGLWSAKGLSLTRTGQDIPAFGGCGALSVSQETGHSSLSGSLWATGGVAVARASLRGKSWMLTLRSWPANTRNALLNFHIWCISGSRLTGPPMLAELLNSLDEYRGRGRRSQKALLGYMSCASCAPPDSRASARRTAEFAGRVPRARPAIRKVIAQCGTYSCRQPYHLAGASDFGNRSNVDALATDRSEPGEVGGGRCW